MKSADSALSQKPSKIHVKDNLNASAACRESSGGRGSDNVHAPGHRVILDNCRLELRYF